MFFTGSCILIHTDVPHSEDEHYQLILHFEPLSCEKGFENRRIVDIGASEVKFEITDVRVLIWCVGGFVRCDFGTRLPEYIRKSRQETGIVSGV